MKIVPDKSPIEIDAKRWYPPFGIRSCCPHCGEVIRFDEYISWPVFNTPTELQFKHRTRDRWHEWSEWIILRMSAEPCNPPEDS